MGKDLLNDHRIVDAGDDVQGCTKSAELIDLVPPDRAAYVYDMDAVDRAIGHFREPVRMEDLCRATGVRLRTLQRSFRQCFGVTVTSYLKAVRLNAAYRDLIAADPARDTVTAIALRNGCRHLGRFSSEFRERFGQLPRETLRREPSELSLPITHCPQ